MVSRKEEIETAIRALQTSLDKLMAERSRLDQKVSAIRQAIDVLEQQESEGPLDGQVAGTYAGLGAAGAVTQFLVENLGKKYKASEVRKQIKRRGYHTKAKAEGSLVSATLNRLAKSEKSPVQVGERANVKVYWIEKGPDAPEVASGLQEGVGR